MGLSEAEVTRFWAKVDKSGECWIWRASTFSCSGYGQFACNLMGTRRSWQTHRIAWVLATGKIPGRRELIGHRCGNRLCVRFDHLFSGYTKGNRWGTTPSKTCTACGAIAWSRSMCKPHYQEWRAANPAIPTCAADACDRKVYAHRLCKHHHAKSYRTNPDRPKCSVEGCEKLVTCRGYCKMHHSRLLSEGAPGEAAPRRAPNGSGHINPNGYRLVYRDGVPTLEHRLIMERVCGRPLLEHEEVHHRNGDRADNRVENLELWSHSQPAGQRIVDKVKWAMELLRLYAPEVLL